MHFERINSGYFGPDTDRPKDQNYEGLSDSHPLNVQSRIARGEQSENKEYRSLDSEHVSLERDSNKYFSP